MKFSEFKASVADIPRTISDEPQGPTPINGTVIPPGADNGYDPSKPWRSLDVDSYVPVVGWVLKAASKVVANAIVKEPLMAFDDEDMDALDTALTEATQRCLFDLKLAWVDHPYAKLGAAVLGLGAVKYAAAKLLRDAMEAERRERQTGGRQNVAQPKPNAPENTSSWEREGRAGGPVPRPQSPPPRPQNPPSPVNQYDPPAPPLHPQAFNARNQPGTPQASPMANGRMPGSGDVSSFVGYRIQESPGSSSSEYDLPDE